MSTKVGIIVQPQGNPKPSQSVYTEPAEQASLLQEGLTAFSFMLGRLGRFNLGSVIASVSEHSAWDEVAKIAKRAGVNVHRVSDKNRLANTLQIAEAEDLGVVVRWTGDSFGDADITRAGVDLLLASPDADLVDNYRGGPTGKEGIGYPAGFNYDVVRTAALQRVQREIVDGQLAIEGDTLHAGIPTIREFSDPAHAHIFGLTPFKTLYLNPTGDLGYDPTNTPSFNCVNPDQFQTLNRIFKSFIKSGINPYDATIDQAMSAAGAPALVASADVFAYRASTKLGGTTEALIQDNLPARYALLRQRTQQRLSF